jgi:polyisoprenoid-binding protein YceI
MVQFNGHRFPSFAGAALYPRRVSLRSGVHRLGPENATLSVRTGRAGAAARAGHDLLIRVTSWEAELAVGEDAAETNLQLNADSTSLRVVEGTGGMQALGDDDVASIEKTIDEEILKRDEIAFRSTRVRSEPGGERLRAEGDLTLAGRTGPITFDLAVDGEGTLRAAATVRQSAWGIKPYSALFGALKVADEVEVALEGQVKPQSM